MQGEKYQEKKRLLLSDGIATFVADKRSIRVCSEATLTPE
jgi:hypothetical protein